jgi:hypothetical protein
LLYSMSNLCVNWAYSRALATCDDLVSVLSLMLGRFAAEVGNNNTQTMPPADCGDEYWRDSSVLECLLLCLFHLCLSLPTPRAPTVTAEAPSVSYDVEVIKGGPGVALGMMVVQDAAGVIRLKSMQRDAPVATLGPEADGCMCAGDMLVGINGQDISSWDLAAAVVELNDRNLPPGQTVRLTYRRPLSRIGKLWLLDVRSALESLLLSFFRRRSAPCVVTETAARHGMLLLALLGNVHHPIGDLCRNPVYDRAPAAPKDKDVGKQQAEIANDKSCSVWHVPQCAPKPAASGRTVLVSHSMDISSADAGNVLLGKFVDALRDQASVIGASVVTSTVGTVCLCVCLYDYNNHASPPTDCRS